MPQSAMYRCLTFMLFWTMSHLWEEILLLPGPGRSVAWDPSTNSSALRQLCCKRTRLWILMFPCIGAAYQYTSVSMNPKHSYRPSTTLKIPGISASLPSCWTAACGFQSLHKSYSGLYSYPQSVTDKSQHFIRACISPFWALYQTFRAPGRTNYEKVSLGCRAGQSWIHTP